MREDWLKPITDVFTPDEKKTYFCLNESGGETCFLSFSGITVDIDTQEDLSKFASKGEIASFLLDRCEDNSKRELLAGVLQGQ
ncbi:MAG TPA: hypothetical protein DDW52_16645 [Planctomycetaceae bacterium]|nr:hypothetical protein [Planctomycetaceae bacterium]